MSFILDALKKVEQEKRRGQVMPRLDSVALASMRNDRKRRFLTTGAIALASASLTAIALTLLPGSDHDAEGPSNSAATSVSAAQTILAPTRTISSREAEPVAIEVAEPRRPRPEPSVDPVTKSPGVADASPAGATGDSGEAALDWTSSNADVAAGEDEPSPPMHLVGRERVARESIRTEADPTPDNSPVPGGESEPAPDDFRNLVLQGTSVLNGIAVAVISERRVFEGDVIDGARVVRIDEREVELEFEGRRFTLRL